MANRNHRGDRDRQDRDRRYNRQAEQFDSTEYGWVDEGRGQMGEGAWRDEEYAYIRDELPTHPRGRYGPNLYASQQGAGFASFTGSDQGGRDFTAPRYTGDRTSSAGYGFGFRPDHPRDDHGERGWFERAGDEVASWFGNEDATRRREEDHRGKGPSGYIRSDERIQEDANDRLTDDHRVDARNVQVGVSGGEITLDGTVGSRAQKHRAEHCVEDISGVKHVQNNLRVQEASAQTATEAAR